jgi:hypothetical protein
MAVPWLAILNAAQNVGGATMDALPYIIKTDYEKENKKRLEELKRMKELDTLGLSESEKQAIAERYSAPLQAAQAQQLSEQRRILATQAGTGAGQGLAQMARSEQALARAASAQGQAITEADRQREQEQEEEYWARLAWQAQKKQERVAAWSSIGKAAIKGKQESSALTQTTSNGGAVNDASASYSDADVQAFAKEYNVSEEEASSALSKMANNPNLQEGVAMLAGGK